MRGARGFSLIEVVISIFIVGIMLLVLQSVLQSNVLARTSKNRSVALTAARNELEGLRAGGFAALPASGPFSNSLLDALPGAVATRSVDDYDAGTTQVVVTVEWQDAGATASSTVSLATLITHTGGLP